MQSRVKALKVAGAENLFAAEAKAAAALGYAVTEDEVKAHRKAQSSALSDELLSSVSGGFICSSADKLPPSDC